MPSKRKLVGLDENAKGLGSQDKEHCRRGEKSLCMRNVPVVFRFSKRVCHSSGYYLKMSMIFRMYPIDGVQMTIVLFIFTQHHGNISSNLEISLILNFTF